MIAKWGERLERAPASGRLSRRDFGRIAALFTAGSAVSFSAEQVLAQLSAFQGTIPADAVKIDANENPMGPCAEALEAALKAVRNGGRYMFGETDAFVDAMATAEELKKDYVRAYPGSSAALHQAVMAFTSPERPLVMADPGYEAAGIAAEANAAKSIRVPLTKDYAHDASAMVAAGPSAGVFYICNPNNPTGTLTPREDIEWLLANKPNGSIVLLDEAYIHISEARTCSDLVAADKDLVILRTFSKLYGMAGLRAGAALARPDLLKQIGRFMSTPQPTAGWLPRRRA